MLNYRDTTWRGDAALNLTQRAEVSSQVEIVLVKVAHQPFGLLMSQIYNIVRPENQGVKVKTRPDPEAGREWGEIEYRGDSLMVLELARMLKMPLVEPIERSQILLSGKLQPNGAIVQPFGVACDDILSITRLPLDDMRPIAEWLFRKRLGKLIWSAALVDRKLLAEQQNVNPVSQRLMEEAQVEQSLQELGLAMPPVLESVPLTKFNDILRLKRDTKPRDERFPVMLLDLDVLRRLIYGSLG